MDNGDLLSFSDSGFFLVFLALNDLGFCKQEASFSWHNQ